VRESPVELTLQLTTAFSMLRVVTCDRGIVSIRIELALAPLFKEERNAGCVTLVANGCNPRAFNLTCMRTGFPSHNHPVNSF
jgi:hypothetical protein